MTSFYPQGPKSEWASQAKAIVDGNQTLTSEQLAFLLKWLQDGNWPGAPEIAMYLVHRADCLISSIRDVLKSRDFIWIYWVLLLLITKLPKRLCELLKSELYQIAFNFDDEGAHVLALEICAKHQLDDKVHLKKIIAAKISKDPEHKEEYEKITMLLTE